MLESSAIQSLPRATARSSSGGCLANNLTRLLTWLLTWLLNSHCNLVPAIVTVIHLGASASSDLEIDRSGRGNDLNGLTRLLQQVSLLDLRDSLDG